MSDLIKLGGLWQNKDKNGRQYLSGRLSPTVRILIFKNEFRSADNQPAFQMYLAPVDPQPGDDTRTEKESDEFFADDLPAADPEASTRRPAAAAPAVRPAPPRTDPRADTTPARPALSRPAPATASTRPAPRRAEPAAEAFVDDMEDPFAE